jgi:hypothetical protein
MLNTRMKIKDGAGKELKNNNNNNYYYNRRTIEGNSICVIGAIDMWSTAFLPLAEALRASV